MPEPVGATTSVLSPLEIDAHAPACAGVGAVNAPVNHSRVSALKARSGSALARASVAGLSGGAASRTAPFPVDVTGTYPSCLVPPTFRTAHECSSPQHPRRDAPTEGNRRNEGGMTFGEW